MTLTHGADAERLTQIAAQLTDLGRQTTKVGSEGAARLGVLGGVWVGSDLERFTQHWRAAERQLDSCAERLTTMATLMTEQAGQQIDASDGAGAHLPGPVPTGPGGPRSPGPPGPGEGGSSFDEDVRGTEGQPVDKDLWALAHHSYGSDNDLYDDPYMYDEQPDLPEGYAAVDPEELGVDPELLSEDHGMQAGIYRTPDGGYVVAYRGSDETIDWVTNARQGVGMDDPQYEQAMQLASAVHTASGGDVTFTGHSLGGGLAAAAAMATGQPAVTFDAAGVHGDTAERAAEIRGAGATEESVLAETGQGQIRTYSMETDILTNVQEATPLVDAPGTSITLETPESEQRQALQDHYGDRGAEAGGLIGGVLGGMGGAMDGDLSDLGEEIQEGAETGAGLGRDLGAWGADQVWGHHWNPVEEALEGRYPG